MSIPHHPVNYNRSQVAIAVFVLFCVAIYFPLFLHLDSFTLRIYDEARRGVNALEMLNNGQWLIPHYSGQPDMWGTKPPVLIWLQVVSFHLFGINTLAVRLPVSVAGLCTVLLLILFAYRHLRNIRFGYLAGLVLLTSSGYVRFHGIRSGDYDGLLTLFTTGMVLVYYVFLKRRQWRYLYITTIFMILACLTKGVTGLFFLPALLLYTIFSKQLMFLLRSRHLYYNIGLFILFVLGYYLLRESQNPGYLQAVWENELGGRFLSTVERHGKDPWYFIRLIATEKFKFWIPLLPLAVFLGWTNREGLSPLTKYLLLCILFFLLVISTSQTKLSWYDVPVYPLLALLVAVGIELLLQALRSLYKNRSTWLLKAFFIIGLFAWPYRTIVQHVYHRQDNQGEWKRMQFGYFMEQLTDVPAYDVGAMYYNPSALFYADMYRQKGQEVYTYDPGARTTLGKRVVLCEKKAKELFAENHEFTVLRSWQACVLVEVISWKE